MNLKEEKRELQALFEPFEELAFMQVSNADESFLVEIPLLVAIQVQRIGIDFDAEGEEIGRCAWITFVDAAFEQGPQFTHTLKIIEWGYNGPDEYIILMRDFSGRHFRLEQIYPDLEPARARTVAAWVDYKVRGGQDLIARLDAALEAHRGIAEEWGDPMQPGELEESPEDVRR